MAKLDSKATPWKYFYGDGNLHPEVKIEKLPEAPPWRRFRDIEKMSPVQKNEMRSRWQTIQKLAGSEENQRETTKGKNFRLQTEVTAGETPESLELAKAVIAAVNAAIHLRRPLLITGNPGSGKTSLAYAIAYELNLGPVLSWAITSRSTLQQGLYRYDALARLQDAEQKEEEDIGQYIQLGAVGTAFLPWEFPRVLLIDEIDKSDMNLPNDLLHLFEEGTYPIPELERRAKANQASGERVKVRTEDTDIEAEIERGRVRCCAFPIVVMTSNGERDFPAAFLRRCIRVKMPDPKEPALINIIKAHFEFDEPAYQGAAAQITPLIGEFLKESGDRATDQLLNTIYLLAQHVSVEASDREALLALLLKKLSSSEP